jgi:conflict system STAND superfamily ATPase
MDIQSQLAAATQVSWPREPYKGFSYYTSEDTLLFVGRDEDVDDCAAYLAEPKTRTLLLHGRTGCGKSSFLRAGLIPALESHGLGFVFLRRNEGERPTLIRCTADPMTRLAEELFWFTSHPREYETAIGLRKIDISDARMGKNDIRAFAESCQDPEFLMGVLKAISGKLSHTLIIILDQAEEAIAQDEGRSPFFDFLKLFNGAGLDVKLVIALRTERFGEFFGYLHFGASAITDIKQYFLKGLDRSKVRDAIELPTLKSPIGDHEAPFGVYGFEYEEGLVDTIVADLFSAPPSGGILPLMQVVCRGLYHEVRDLAVPKVITRELYRSGGGVTGRVDKQIGQSLRTIIKRYQPSIRDIESEEAKWRAGLYKLVRTQPDGTVGTDLKAEEDLRKILRDSGVTGDIPAMLAALADTEVLILRSFKAISADSAAEVVVYSLGHDAIGLVLRQWMLRFDEAEKSRRVLRRRTKIFAATAATVLVASLVLLSYVIGVSEKRRKMVEIDVLKSYADGQFRSDPRTTSTAAINASMLSDSLLLRGSTSPVQSTLANIAATLPHKTVQTSFSKVKRGLAGGISLPQARKFLFWNADEGVEFVDWDSERRSKLDLAALYGDLAASPTYALDGRPKPAILADATEVASDVFMLQFQTATSGMEFISIVQNGHVVGTYDRNYFLNLSDEVQSLFGRPIIGSADAQEPILPRPPRLGIDANIVYLYRSTPNTMRLAAFYLDRQRAGRFSIGASVSDEGARETVTKRYLSFPPGLLFLLTYSPAPTQPPRGADLRPSKGADQRRLADVRAYDLRKKQENPEMWSLDTSGNSTIRECLDRPEITSNLDLSSEACVFRPVDRGGSNFLVIMVPPKAKEENSSELRDDQFALVTMDLENQRTVRIDATTMMKISDDKVFGPKRVPIDFRKVALGGGFGSMVIAVPITPEDPNAEVIEVFRMDGSKAEFVGTYAASSEMPGRISFTDDGRTMAAIDGRAGRLWDISHFAGADLAKQKSSAQLVKMICDSDLPIEVGKDAWRNLIGLDSTPQPPCAN